MEQQLHFIIGIGRSGTTILSKLLNRYTQVHALPEINFFTFFYNSYSSKKKINPSDIELIFEQIKYYTESHYTPIWQINIDETKKLALSALKNYPHTDYISICKLIFKEIKVVGIDKSEAQILIHKSPITTLFAEKIIKRVPQTKFIWIVRDYRASALSLKQSIHSKPVDVAYNACRWAIYNRKAYALKQKHPNNVLLVKYEDLVTNSEFEFNRIESFLEIKNEYEKTDFEKIQLEKIKELPISNKQKDRYLKKHTDLSKPLNSNRAYVWREQLSDMEINTTEVVCNEIGSKLGYLPTSTSLNYNYFTRSMLNAKWNIIKEYILFYIPVRIKITRLKKNSNSN